MAGNNNTILVGQMMKPEVRMTKTGKTVAKARMVIKATMELILMICGYQSTCGKI